MLLKSSRVASTMDGFSREVAREVHPMLFLAQMVPMENVSDRN